MAGLYFLCFAVSAHAALLPGWRLAAVVWAGGAGLLAGYWLVDLAGLAGLAAAG